MTGYLLLLCCDTQYEKKQHQVKQLLAAENKKFRFVTFRFLQHSLDDIDVDRREDYFESTIHTQMRPQIFDLEFSRMQNILRDI